MATNTCFFLIAIVCAASASCTAALNFAHHHEHSGVRVHVHPATESLSEEESDESIIKIRFRLPLEEVDTCAMTCVAELEGKSIGDLYLTEVPPYALVWPAEIYGAADLWSCSFEWLDHNLVIGKTDIWNSKQGSVTWKIDASGLEILDESNDSYEFVKAWEKKTSGIALFV